MPDLILEISSLAQDGRGVGRSRDTNFPELFNMTVFARGALPGETALVRIAKIGASYAEGEKIAAIQPVPEYNAAFCSKQGICGGCPLQPMPYARQLEWKGRLARENLARIGKMEPAFISSVFESPLPSPVLIGFRNKMEFAFARGGDGGLILGQRKAGSLEVVPVLECPLLPAGHAPILHRLGELAGESGLPAWKPGRRNGGQIRGNGFWRYFILRHGLIGGAAGPAKRGWLGICVTSPGSRVQRRHVRNIAEKLLHETTDFLGFVHEERKADDLWRQADRRVFSCGETILRQELGGRSFALDAASFAQINTRAANLLAGLARDMALANPAGDMLDLFCGVGAPGLLAASAFDGILGVDSQAASIEMAAKNASGSGNCVYKADSVDNFLNKNSGRHWHTILADPPRAGLGATAIRNINLIRPQEIVYISCNPATFARDASLLGENYQLNRLASVDLFPHTAHLELCSRWTRKK